jgi:adenine-specific DNA-methyltransferase
MPEINFRSIILSVLEADERIWFQNEEGEKELNQTLLLDLVEKIDDKIINLLLQEESLREKFFAKISPDTTEKQSTYVFKMNEFRFFMEENKIDNSYTAYKNRIGLTDGKKFLKDSNDIVLNWPYKDCILEGGQSNEEGTDTYFEKIPLLRDVDKVDGVDYSYIQKQAKRKEIFFNSVLAPDEIDRLLDPKALVNWKRFADNGELSMMNYELKRRKDGTIAENMIIKGNNLLAMHSLKKQFAGKVKLIYIDPPYNTGNDGFKYNDNFNHSTWLTFMKNRLEVARELLREDGVIFVSCDDNEQAYLKVLMDEVFEKDNFIGNVIRKTGSNRNMGNIGRSLDVRHENLIIFSKKSTANIFYGIQQNVNNDEIYTQDFTVRTGGFEYEIPSLDFSIKFKRKWGKKEEDLKILLGGDVNSTYEELYKNVIYIKEMGWFKLNDFIFKSKNGIINKIKDKKDKKLVHSLWIDIESQKNVNTHFEELNLEFSNPKLESMIQRIIEISTQPSDIVLDYHLGSGTTAAVAHKMGRQYIGIEQMDYVETIAVERLKKVIAGEQGGISKAVNWQGGGDFIYFELAKWNEVAKERILAAESIEQLIEFFDEMYERYFLNYNLKIQEFRDKIIQEESFQNLPLAEQKQIFIAMLDNNQMYVNKSEMSDAKFGISEEEQALTEEFYKS